MLKTVKNTIIILLTTASVYYCTVFPQEIGTAVKQAVDRCLYTIIPSMFIFMCITCFISKSGIHTFLSIPFKFISEKFFRIPKEGFSIFLLSMISGYPVGIKLVYENFSKNILTQKQAKTMNSYCCCAGPAFITGIAGIYLYPNSNAGLLLYLSVIIGNIVTALILSVSLPKINSQKHIRCSLNKGCFIPSVKSASSALLQMCIMIVAFGGLSEILKLSGIIGILSDYTSAIFNIPTDITKNIILSLLEISNIVNLPPMTLYIFPVTAFLISFGGICVHMQIYSITENKLPLHQFLISRIFSASVSATISVFLMRFLNADISCDITYKAISNNNYSPIPSLFLIIMITIFLYSFDNKKAKH